MLQQEFPNSFAILTQWALSYAFASQWRSHVSCRELPESFCKLQQWLQRVTALDQTPTGQSTVYWLGHPFKKQF